jgi:hypothetical protein
VSVSSHLSPEPERRLWLLLESLRGEARDAEWKLLALAAVAAVQAALGPRGAAGWVAALGALAVLPWAGTARALPGLDSKPGRHGIDDSFLRADDLAKYAAGELVLKLDRYFGGGVTATPYYEDLVAEIAVAARAARRRRRLLWALGALFAAAQLG